MTKRNTIRIFLAVIIACVVALFPGLPPHQGTEILRSIAARILAAGIGISIVMFIGKHTSTEHRRQAAFLARTSLIITALSAGFFWGMDWLVFAGHKSAPSRVKVYIRIRNDSCTVRLNNSSLSVSPLKSGGGRQICSGKVATENPYGQKKISYTVEASQKKGPLEPAWHLSIPAYSPYYYVYAPTSSQREPPASNGILLNFHRAGDGRLKFE